MQMLHHSLLVKEIFLSMKWKYLCLKPSKMGICELEFMHFFMKTCCVGIAKLMIKTKFTVIRKKIVSSL